MEMDAANAELARRNLGPVSERARVVEAAAWTCSGTVTYSLSAGAEWAAHIESGGDRQAVACVPRRDHARVRARRLREDGRRRRGSGPARRARAVDPKVRDIKVEVHEPYSIERYLADLESAGFDARVFSTRYRLVVGRNRRRP